MKNQPDNSHHNLFRELADDLDVFVEQAYRALEEQPLTTAQIAFAFAAGFRHACAYVSDYYEGGFSGPLGNTPPNPGHDEMLTDIAGNRQLLSTHKHRPGGYWDTDRLLRRDIDK
ncbi:hypothetical protein [Botrimarina mediterranea]|uniref:hypothetical protein n=1 Tax=Botrimarina mediterranea TaxID=2528022 RepID=UPI00118B5B35|nr:hypothetical protein K2D_46760 [Planctomycetes bacterium K2D]